MFLGMNSMNTLMCISTFRFLVISNKVICLIKHSNLLEFKVNYFLYHMCSKYFYLHFQFSLLSKTGGMKIVVVLMVLFSWIWSILLALPPLLGWGTFVPEMNGMSCAPGWTEVGWRLWYIFDIIMYKSDEIFHKV